MCCISLKAVNLDHMLILQCKIAKNTVTMSVKMKHLEEWVIGTL